MIRLTDNNCNWGFGLCFLYLRNVKSFGRNHKCVYRSYRKQALNLQIKLKKRIVREKPAALRIPAPIIQVWSTDFINERLSERQCIRLFTVIDDFNREARGIDVDFSLPLEHVILSLRADHRLARRSWRKPL